MELYPAMKLPRIVNYRVITCSSKYIICKAQYAPAIEAGVDFYGIALPPVVPNVLHWWLPMPAITGFKR